MRDCDVAKERFRALFEEKVGGEEMKRFKKLLAPRKTCDIFAPVSVPHFSDRGEFEQGLSGEGRESNSGVS
jgi:hypothetical protein